MTTERRRQKFKLILNQKESLIRWLANDEAQATFTGRRAPRQKFRPELEEEKNGEVLICLERWPRSGTHVRTYDGRHSSDCIFDGFTRQPRQWCKR